MKAQWKIKGVFKADAQKVAEEIGDRKITPKELLEKARDEKSELHKCIEWDDGVAAEKYRLIQAQNILRMLVYESKDEETPPVRIFSLTTEQSTYQPTRLFLQQEDEYIALLKRAKAELQAFKQKYKALSELETIFNEIEAL